MICPECGAKVVYQGLTSLECGTYKCPNGPKEEKPLLREWEEWEDLETLKRNLGLALFSNADDWKQYYVPK